MKVSSNTQINGTSLENFAKSGYFSLIPTDGGVKVEMPLVVFALLNGFPRFQICDSTVLNPFDPSWKGVEVIAIASLQANIRALQQKGKTSAM